MIEGANNTAKWCREQSKKLECLAEIIDALEIYEDVLSIKPGTWQGFSSVAFRLLPRDLRIQREYTDLWLVITAYYCPVYNDVRYHVIDEREDEGDLARLDVLNRIKQFYSNLQFFKELEHEREDVLESTGN